MAPFVAFFSRFLPQFSLGNSSAIPASSRSRQVAQLGHEHTPEGMSADQDSYLAFFKTTDILHNSILPPRGADLIESDTPLQQRVTASLCRTSDLNDEAMTFRHLGCEPKSQRCVSNFLANARERLSWCSAACKSELTLEQFSSCFPAVGDAG